MGLQRTAVHLQLADTEEFNWQTPKSGASHYYRIGVQLDSGDMYATLIVLK